MNKELLLALGGGWLIPAPSDYAVRGWRMSLSDKVLQRAVSPYSIGIDPPDPPDPPDPEYWYCTIYDAHPIDIILNGIPYIISPNFVWTVPFSISNSGITSIGSIPAEPGMLGFNEVSIYTTDTSIKSIIESLLKSSYTVASAVSVCINSFDSSYNTLIDSWYDYPIHFAEYDYNSGRNTIALKTAPMLYQASNTYYGICLSLDLEVL